jgi:hypothetical protein
MEKFVRDELDAVRKRLDRMQTELDEALRLANSQAALATALATRISDRLEEMHRDILAEFRSLHER